MTLEEFKTHRIEWITEWFEKYRLLDIDFETYMLMKGISPEKYKQLNEEDLKENK
jgi:hypothetical protein